MKSAAGPCRARRCVGKTYGFMCDDHWRVLPKAMRDLLTSAHERDPLGEQFLRAAIEAIDFIAIDEMPGEDLAWRDVNGFAGIYSVSEFGHVVDLRTGKRRRWEVNSAGYPHMKLRDARGYHWRLVHAMVAEAFIGPRPTGKTINHEDGNKMRPHVRNLSYVSQRDNNAHARRLGLRPQRGHRPGVSIVVAEAIASGRTIRDVAGAMGISSTTVRRHARRGRAA